MPSTLILKNIPDAVYQRLNESAQANRRSASREAIVRLEPALFGHQPDAGERLVRARAVREVLPPAAFSACGLDAAKRQGRA